MNRAPRYALAVAAAVVLTFLAVWQRAPQAQAAPGDWREPAREPARRWEYAALRFNLLSGGKWDWISPAESITEDKQRIYRHLGGQGRTAGGISYVDIATQAGQQGWEVIAVLERERGTEVWFKRPGR